MRGFVLQPTYRIVAGRPEVHLYGVLENGEPFLVIDDRARPYFFVPADRAGAVGGAGARVDATDLHAFDGEPVARVTLAVPGDVPPLRRASNAAGIQCFEADVRFAYRYLIDRGLRGALRDRGAWRRRGPPPPRLSQSRARAGALDPPAEGALDRHRDRT